MCMYIYIHMYACIYSLLYIESCCYSLWTYTSQRGGTESSLVWLPQPVRAWWFNFAPVSELLPLHHPDLFIQGFLLFLTFTEAKS